MANSPSTWADVSAHWPARLLRRWIPSRLNRFLWTLMAMLMGVFSVVGPVARALIAARLKTLPVWPTFLSGLLVSLVSLVIGLGVGGWLLRRWSGTEMTTRRQLEAVLTTFGAGLVGHAIVVALIGMSARSRNTETPIAQLTELAISIPLIILMAAVVLYAGRREQELEQRYEDLLTAHLALVREEEDVRARIFDELHGTAQARIVEARMRAQAIADRSADATLQEEALQLDRDLLDLYQSQIGRMARALYPAGLEVSLLAAIGQLRERNEGVIQINLTTDALVPLLDDPMSAGLHRDLRIVLYRVVEECVTNAIRHGGADEICLDLSADIRTGSSVICLIASNRYVNSPSTQWGHGLTRLNQRVSALGGTASVEVTDMEYIVRTCVPTIQPPLLTSTLS